MKTILSIVMLIATAGAGGAVSHAEVTDAAIKEMTGVIKRMSKVTDIPSAEAFAKQMPEMKVSFRNLLRAAQQLPAPTDEEKKAFAKRMKQVEEEAGPMMMEMMMGLATNPDAEAIGKILQEAMMDEDMEEITEALEAIYEAGEKGKLGAEEKEVAPLIE